LRDIRKIDFLIAGQGLAGSILSWYLIQKGRTCLVVDPCEEFTSSRVAAGLIHPVTGRRLSKSWKADTLIPFARFTYKKLEEELKTSFFHDTPILEVFNDNGHRNDWMMKSEEGSIKSFLGELVNPAKVNSKIKAPLGGQQIINSGWLDTTAFLDAYRRFLMENNSFINDTIENVDISLQKSEVKWKDIRANYLINCTGFIAKNNPWFSNLPFLPAKGEILTIGSNEIPEDQIIHHSIKIIPQGKKRFICGATFSWDELNSVPTEVGLEKLKEGLSKTTSANYEILEHKAGVRPSTQDRRPFAGLHQEHPQLGIFNGLGSKGVMIAPWLAEQFAEYLINGAVLNEECDIKRFR
jgi:glycine/D-amino acid oxidase-like deaminating enzyme